MSAAHGRNATLTVNAGAMTGFSNDASLSRSTDTAEVSVFGQAAKTYVPGMNDGTFSSAGFYDSTATTGSIAILEAVYAGGAAVACVYRPAGAGSGNYSYAFSAIMTQFDINGTISDAVSITYEFQISGPVTPSVI